MTDSPSSGEPSASDHWNLLASQIGAEPAAETPPPALPREFLPEHRLGPPTPRSPNPLRRRPIGPNWRERSGLKSRRSSGSPRRSASQSFHHRVHLKLPARASRTRPQRRPSAVDEAKSGHVNATVPTAAGGAGDTGMANHAATNDPADIVRKPSATSGHRDPGTKNRPSRATRRLPTRTTILRLSKRRPTSVQRNLRSTTSIAALSTRPKPALNRRRSGRLVVAAVVVGAEVVDRAVAPNPRAVPKPVMPPTLSSAMKL